MAKINGNYEALYILNPALDEESIAALVAKFKAVVEAGDSAAQVEEWGKRRLAYAINYKTEGYYVLMYITAPADLPRELERNFRIADAVLRSLVIRFEGPIPAKREPLKPFVAREAAPAAEAPVEAAAAPAAEAAAPAEAPAEEADSEAPKAEIE